MNEPTQISAESLRAMLSFIAKDLGIEDPYKQTNAITLTRDIRSAIEALKTRLHELYVVRWGIESPVREHSTTEAGQTTEKLPSGNIAGNGDPIPAPTRAGTTCPQCGRDLWPGGVGANLACVCGALNPPVEVKSGEPYKIIEPAQLAGRIAFVTQRPTYWFGEVPKTSAGTVATPPELLDAAEHIVTTRIDELRSAAKALVEANTDLADTESASMPAGLALLIYAVCAGIDKHIVVAANIIAEECSSKGGDNWRQEVADKEPLLDALLKAVGK